MYTHERLDRTYRPRVRVPYPPVADGPGPQRAFDRYLTRRHLDPALALANGWYPSYAAGDDALRIVIPAANTGCFPFWQARAVQPDVEPRYQSPHGVPREDSVVLVWSMGERRAGRPVVVVVEGPMDALAAAGTGADGVSLMGAMPPLIVFDHMARLFAQSTEFLVIPDTDMLHAGLALARYERRRGCLARLCVLPLGWKDLAELPPEARASLIYGGA